MTVREPAVAGLFYPAGRRRLAEHVAACLDAPIPGRAGGPSGLRALIVPHAGYVYSGPVAGAAYRLLPPLRSRLRRVLLIGPAHMVPLRGLALSSASAWRTPLGDAPVDVPARSLLLEASAGGAVPVAVDDAAHRPEHSLEVQVPFLQTVLPDLPLLPVLVGAGDTDAAADLLRPWWDDPDTLLVLSTDLSHYEPHGQAREHDARTAAAICRAEPDSIGDRDACGSQPLRVLLRLAQRTGDAVRLLDLRTSADTAGNPDRVVGYGAFAIGAAT
jgi:MEMO1 family protein